jgi:uncharacterized repeat protein (TIGR01451 family)
MIRISGRYLAAATLAIAGMAAVCMPAQATPFTETVPNGNGPIPNTYPAVGGTMFVLIGANGNIYYQFVNPSTQFRGFQLTGNPAAFRGSPEFQLGPAQALNCGIVSCTDYFGGSIVEGYARLTARDGDTCDASTGSSGSNNNFDYQDVEFEINGITVTNLSDLPANSVERTNFAGDTSLGFENCFRNQGSSETSTGWFDLTPVPGLLNNILTTGSTTPFINDSDGWTNNRGDNFWFFDDGNDATGTPEVAPGIEIIKTADRTDYTAVGDIINYSFEVRNIGSVQLNSIVVTDSFITGAVSCPQTSLVSGETMTCTGQHVVTQQNIDDDIVFVNTAQVTANPTEGQLGNVSGTLTIPGPPANNSMTLTKTASNDTDVAVGETITYTYVVTNTGNITMDDVTISDAHGGVGTLSSMDPLEVDDLAPTETATFTATYVVQQGDLDAGNTISNTATVSGVPKRGTVADVDAMETITLVAPNPAATFAKLASPDSDVSEGDTITYTYTVTNTGNVTLDATVSDVQSGTGTLSAISPASQSIAPGANGTFTATYVVTQADFDAGTDITNTATAAYTPARGTLADQTADATVTVAAPAPASTLTKTASDDTDVQAGDVITYTYRFTNTGDVTLTDVSVSDVHSGTGTLGAITPASVPSLAPDAFADFTADYTVTQADIDAATAITNTATGAATPERGSLTAPTADESVSVETPAPAMTMVKTASNDTDVAVGDVITYTYRVTNTGNISLSDVSVSDVHSGQGTLSAISPTSASIAPGDFVDFTADYTVTLADIEADADITNTATVTAMPASGTLAPVDASETVTVEDPAPAATLVKTADQTAGADVGDVITYTYTVTNTGNVTLSDVSVADAHSGTGTLSAVTPTTVTSLAPGAAVDFTASYTITQADVDGGTDVTNTATLSATPATGSLAPVTDSESVSMEVANPAMTLTKTPSITSDAAVGDIITYTYVATNTGNVTLTDVSVSDVHQGAGSLSAIAPATVASLLPGDTATFTATYEVLQADIDAGTPITNMAAGTATPARGTLTDPTANASVALEQADPAMTMVKTASNDTDLAVGDVITYSYLVTNTGNVSLSAISVSDVHNGTGTLGAITPASVATLAVGDSVTFTADYTVTQADIDAGSTIGNTATVSATPAQGVLDPVTADETVDVETPAPAATLVKMADVTANIAVGDVITYTYTLTNTGNVGLTNASVTDVHSGTGTLSAITPANVASLAPGASVDFTATYTVTQADIDAGAAITNTATANATPAGGTFTPPTDDETITLEPGTPLVDFTKVASPDSDLAVGDIVTYTYTVRNTGNVSLTDVSVSDVQDGAGTLSAITPANVASLPVGASATFTATYTVVQADLDAGAPLANRAQVSATPAQGTLPNTTADETVTVENPAPAMTIAKRALDTDFAAVGDVLSYEFDVANTGNVTINGISVSDDKIASVSCPVSTLAPGASTTCSADYTVTQDDLNAGSVTNIASVSGTPTGGTLTPPTDTATVNGTQTPSLSVDKRATTTTFAAVGDTLTYEYDVTNTGNVEITAISVSDDRIASVSCPVTTLAPGASTTCTATDTVSQADLDAGSVTNIATTSGTPAGGTLAPATDTETVNADQMPALALVKTARTTTVAAVGDIITYDFTVTNTGNVSITDPITVDDDKVQPPRMVVCDALPAGGLAPGATLSCEMDYEVRQDDLDAGSITNTARATDGTTTSADASDTVTATQSPALSLVKEAAEADFDAVGDTLSYSYSLTNSGNVRITDVSVTDDRIASVTCAVAAQGNGDTVLDPGETVICTGTDTVTQADLDAGFVTNNAEATGTPAGGPLDPATATETVDADQQPELTLVKTANETSFAAVGDVLTYDYTVSNTGNVLVTDLVVSDDKIATVSCDVAAQGNNDAALDPGEVVVCTASYTVTQADLDAGDVTNVAEATATPAGGTLAPAGDTATVNADQQPSMEVVKTATNINFEQPGDVVDYDYVVTNTGNVTLTTPITVNDNLIASVSCPALPAGGLAPAASLTCTAQYVVTQADLDAGSVTNLASATDGVTTSPQTSETIPADQNPALSVVKDAITTDFTAAGDVLSYRFTLSNDGNLTLTGTTQVVDDKIGTIDCVVGNFTPGTTQICTADYTVTQADVDAGFVTNQAFAQNGSVVSAPVTETVDGTQTPSVSVDKRALDTTFAAAGDTLMFEFDVVNTGNVTLTNITVTDPLIPALSCPATELAPAASLTCSGTYTLTQADVDAGSVVNTADVSATPPSGPAVTDTDSATVTGMPTTDVRFAKRALSTDFAQVGDVLAFEFDVENTGTTTLSAIAISDPLAGTVSCPLTTLAPSASMVCSADYAVTQADIDAGSVENTASLSAEGPDGTPLPPETDTVTVDGTRTPRLSLSKTSPDTDFAAVGDVLNYEYLLQNTGNVVLTDLSVSDDRIAVISCPVTTLAPGESVTCTATDTVTQADLDAGFVTNNAEATATPPAGTTLTPPTDSVTVDADQAPSLAMVKTASLSSVDSVGDTIDYTYEITNTGNVTITDSVSVTDDRISVSCPALPAGGLVPGASLTCTGTDVVSQADLDAGMVTNTASATDGTTTSPDVSETVGVDQMPGLVMTKTASPQVFATLGETVSYDYVVTNTGNVSVTEAITVSDDRITVSCPALPAGGLAPGASLTCTGTDTVTQVDLDSGQITNTAQASSGPTTSPSVTEVATADPRPALSMDKRALTTGYAAAGDRIDYAYDVTNAGNITITDPISVSDDKIDMVSCPALPLAGLAPGATLTCTASYTVTQADVDAGSVTNLATASIPGTSSPQVSETVDGTQNPDLSVTKTALNGAFDAVGDVLAYRYDVRNTGNVTLTNAITIADDKIAAVNCPALPAGGLALNATLTCTATYVVTQADLDAGVVTNIAIASSGGTSSAPDTASVTADQGPALSVVKRALSQTFNMPGDIISYEYDVTNSGNVTLTNPISVSDDKIATVSCPSLPSGGLAPGAAITCSGDYAVTQADIDAGSVTNLASATDGNVTSPTVEKRVFATRVSELEIDKTATSINFNLPGDIVSYQYVVTNAGNVTVTTPISVSDNRIASVDCPALPAGGLAPGDSLTCTADFVVTQDHLDIGVVTNIATATDGTTTSAPDSETIPANANPALEVRKSTTATSYATVGEVITYTFEIENTGNITLTNTVQVIDNKIGAIACFTGNLIPDQIEVCTADYTVTQDDIDNGTLTNDAYAEHPRASSPPVFVTIPAVQMPSMAMVKTADRAQFASVGDMIDYQYVVTNDGNVTLTLPVEITDDRIASVSCPSLPVGGLAPGASLVCTGSDTVSQADLDAGGITNVATAQSGPALSPQASETVDADQTRALDMEKIARTSDFTAVGDTLAYDFIVTNTGNVTITAPVSITDDRIGAVACPALPAGGLLPGGTLLCSATDTVSQADLDAGSVTNTASASDGTTTSPDITETITGTQTPDLTMTKTAREASFAAVGDTLTYDFVITNAGNVTVVDALSITDDRIGAVACPALPAGGLAPGASLTCTASDTVTQADLDAGSVTNVASATDGTTTTDPVTETVAADGQPALSVVKTAQQTAFDMAGETLDYSYVVTNAGNVTITQAVSVNDDRIPNVACPALPADGLVPGASITCTGTDTVAQADVDAGFVTNVASATDGTTVSPTESVTVNGSQTPAYTVDKRALSNTFTAVGDTLSYEFIIRNTGNVSLDAVASIEDDKIGTVACPAMPAGGLVPGAVLSCAADYTVTQADLDAGDVTNIATAQIGTQPPSAPDQVTISGVQEPSLSVVKTSDTSALTMAGQIVSYDYVVTNTGNVTFTDPITVADDKIASVSCPTDLLAPGEALTCSADYTVTQADMDAGEVTNIASATSGDTTSDPVSLSIETDVTRGLSLVKRATTETFTAVGDIVSYAYDVTNTGNTTLTETVSVTDDKIASVDCPATLLAPGEALTCTADYAVTQADLDAGSVTNLATSEAGDSTSPEVSETVEANREPSLRLTKTVAQTVQVAGPIFDVTYTLDLLNDGNVTLTDLSLTDDLEATLAPAVIFKTPEVSADAVTPNPAFDGVDIIELLGGTDTLAVGESATVTILVRIDTTVAGPAQGNTAYAGSPELPGPVMSDDPTVTPDTPSDVNPTPLALLDTDGDGAPDGFESGTEDRDGDGVVDSADYDPTGYFYCEENGDILSGGRIAVVGPNGRNDSIGTANDIVIVRDGSDGFYQFYVTAPGTYTMELTYPTSGVPSTDRLAETDVLDATTLLPANPAVLGASEVGTSGRLSDASLPANPRFYTQFDFEAGDPTILTNNIPMKNCGTPAINLSKTVISGPDIMADGRQAVTYALRVENTGETALENVSLSDDLGVVFGVNNVAVLETRIVPSDSPLSQMGSAAYNGTSSSEMLSSGVDLEIGEGFTVELDVAVAPQQAGEYTNMASVSAEGPLDGAPVNAEDDAMVALQPLSDASQLIVTKTAQPRTVQIGDPVLYQIAVTNDSASTMSDIRITDRLPEGFAYVPDTAFVSDGGDAVAAVPSVPSRGVLNWDVVQGGAAPLDSLAPGETLTFSLRLLAGPNVEFGAHENQAFAESLRDGSRSETATAVVDYIPEPSFDCTPVIGRVYDDVNRNGYPDDGEPGLPGARLATVNGDIITTDEFGRYHIPCAAIANAERGSNFLLKLDGRSLPLAYGVTTENPRVVRATRGKFVKMNFGAAHRPAVRLDIFAADFVSADDNATLMPDAITRMASVMTQAPETERGLLVYHAAEGERVESAQARLQTGLSALRAMSTGLNDIALQADWGSQRPFETRERENGEDETLRVAGQFFDAETIDDRDATNRSRLRFAEGEDGAFMRRADTDLSDDSYGLRQDGDDPVFDGPSVGRRATGPEESTRPNRLMRWLDWGNSTTAYADAMEVETTVTALDNQKRLNARANVVSGEVGRDIVVETYWNYDSYIERAEIRLFEAGRTTRGEPVATATVVDGAARLPVMAEMVGMELDYVLRAYSEDGSFDETAPRSLSIGDTEFDLTPEEWAAQIGSAFGQDSLRVDRIRTPGGTVRVYGRNVAADTVRVMGQNVRVDADGQFVAEQILPTGLQTVNVEADNGYRMIRPVEVKAKDTFAVGQIEATIGEGVDGESFEEGRVAFYVRSRLNDRWAVTATADTGEAGLSNLLNGLDDKDVNGLLRRLDPDRYYPTYGDDSVIEQDAPTSGRIYARVERDDDYLLWGNYQTQFTDTEFGRVRRTLYGAKLRWDGGGLPTTYGDERTEVTAFIAEGGSRQGRDVLRGTGGSVYYLRHGDIAIGSEVVRVETRDSVSGLVTESRRLTYGTDYDLDFIQGRILLTQPLGSTQDDGRLFRDGDLSGNESVLVVDYEYTPVFGADDDAAIYGARVSRWFGDKLKLGATYNHDTDGGAESDLFGLDATLQFGAGTYVKAEVARSEGLGVQAFRSNDGGFTYESQDRGGRIDGGSADALAIEAALDFADIKSLEMEGTTYAYYRNRDAGFAGLAETTNQAIEQFGGGLEVALRDDLTLQARADITDDQTIGTRSYAEATLAAQLSDAVKVTGGLAYSDDARGNSGTSLGGRVDYAFNDSQSVYAFGQVGLSGDNTRTTDRLGVGAETRLSNTLFAGGEVSTGEDGLGARASLRRETDDGDEWYLAYDLPLNSQLAGNLGTLNVGTRQRYSDALSIYGEERLQFAEQGLNGITHAYGVDYAPGDWTFGLSGEVGRVDQFDREAFAATVGWVSERMRAGMSVEWRDDENVDTGDKRNTWLLRTSARYQASEELSLQGKFNLAQSDQSRPDAELGPVSFNNAEFTEGSIAAAYRPIWDDRFNLLGKIVWLDDLSPTSQRFGGQTLDYRQKSTIVSVDTAYDVSPKWTLGGKYAYRSGQVTSSRDSLDFTRSEAELGVLRLDYHATLRWDATVELRRLDIGNGTITRDGGLLGLYRHVGDHAKVGAGLTWGGIEETYLGVDPDSELGWYLNVVGKF